MIHDGALNYGQRKPEISGESHIHSKVADRPNGVRHEKEPTIKS